MIKNHLSKSVIVNRKHLCCNQHQIHIYLLLTENVQNFNFTRKKKELKQFKRNENRQLCAIKNVKKKMVNMSWFCNIWSCSTWNSRKKFNNSKNRKKIVKMRLFRNIWSCSTLIFPRKIQSFKTN